MMQLLKRLWWYLTLPKGWHTERRTMQHPVLGQLRYQGTRLRPGGPVHGAWYVNVDDQPISLAFPTMGGEPTERYLDRLVEILADQDALFERFRSAIAPEFTGMTESPMPAAWRTAFRLDGLDLPPFPDDVDEDGALWQVSYWSEPAMHWFVVHLIGDTIDYVDVAG